MSRTMRIILTLTAFAGLAWMRLLLGFDVYIQVMTTASALLCWTYVLRYHLGSPWRANVVGRSLMYLALSLAVVFTLICTSIVFGDYPGREAVRTAVYSTLPLALAEFVRVLIQVQRGRERGEIPSHHVEGRI